MKKIDVVIMCAGKGTRMGDLTKDIPKPLIKVGDKTLLQHKLDALPENVERIFLIVGHMKDQVMHHVDSLQYKKPIVFIEQKEMLGTAHALWQVKDQIGNDFVSMAGDDLYATKDIEFMSQLDWGMGTFLKPPRIGELSMEKEGNFLTSAVVVDEKFNKEMVNYDTAMYKLKKDIFDAQMVPIKNGKEFGLPHTILKYVKDSGIPLYLHHLSMWEMLNSPEDVERVKKLF